MEIRLFNAEISAGSLMLPESRRIARLLISQPTPQQWDEALNDQNLLQKSPATAKRQARLIRNRLETLDVEGWNLIAEGDSEVASQLLLAASIRHSQLLGEFLRTVYRADLQRLETHLTKNQWDAFLADCEQHDPAVAQWAASTREKLYQVTVRILAEARYLSSTKQLKLTPPMLHPTVRHYLQKFGATDTLKAMEFHK